MDAEFVSLYDSCYDLDQNMPTRTEITVYGTAFDAKARLDSIPVLPDGEWNYDNTELVNLYEKVSKPSTDLKSLKRAFHVTQRFKSSYKNQFQIKYRIP